MLVAGDAGVAPLPPKRNGVFPTPGPLLVDDVAGEAPNWKGVEACACGADPAAEKLKLIDGLLTGEGAGDPKPLLLMPPNKEPVVDGPEDLAAAGPKLNPPPLAAAGWEEPNPNPLLLLLTPPPPPPPLDVCLLLPNPPNTPPKPVVVLCCDCCGESSIISLPPAVV